MAQVLAVAIVHTRIRTRRFQSTHTAVTQAATNASTHTRGCIDIRLRRTQVGEGGTHRRQDSAASTQGRGGRRLIQEVEADGLTVGIDLSTEGALSLRVEGGQVRAVASNVLQGIILKLIIEVVVDQGRQTVDILRHLRVGHKASGVIPSHSGVARQLAVQLSREGERSTQRGGQTSTRHNTTASTGSIGTQRARDGGVIDCVEARSATGQLRDSTDIGRALRIARGTSQADTVRVASTLRALRETSAEVQGTVGRARHTGILLRAITSGASQIAGSADTSDRVTESSGALRHTVGAFQEARDITRCALLGGRTTSRTSRTTRHTHSRRGILNETSSALRHALVHLQQSTRRARHTVLRGGTITSGAGRITSAALTGIGKEAIIAVHQALSTLQHTRGSTCAALGATRTTASQTRATASHATLDGVIRIGTSRACRQAGSVGQETTRRTRSTQSRRSLTGQTSGSTRRASIGAIETTHRAHSQTGATVENETSAATSAAGGGGATALGAARVTHRATVVAAILKGIVAGAGQHTRSAIQEAAVGTSGTEVGAVTARLAGGITRLARTRGGVTEGACAAFNQTLTRREERARRTAQALRGRRTIASVTALLARHTTVQSDIGVGARRTRAHAPAIKQDQTATARATSARCQLTSTARGRTVRALTCRRASKLARRATISASAIIFQHQVGATSHTVGGQRAITSEAAGRTAVAEGATGVSTIGASSHTSAVLSQTSTSSASQTIRASRTITRLARGVTSHTGCVRRRTIEANRTHSGARAIRTKEVDAIARGTLGDSRATALSTVGETSRTHIVGSVVESIRALRQALTSTQSSTSTARQTTGSRGAIASEAAAAAVGATQQARIVVLTSRAASLTSAIRQHQSIQARGTIVLSGTSASHTSAITLLAQVESVIRIGTRSTAQSARAISQEATGRTRSTIVSSRAITSATSRRTGRAHAVCSTLVEGASAHGNALTRRLEEERSRTSLAVGLLSTIASLA